MIWVTRDGVLGRIVRVRRGRILVVDQDRVTYEELKRELRDQHDVTIAMVVREALAASVNIDAA